MIFKGLSIKQITQVSDFNKLREMEVDSSLTLLSEIFVVLRFFKNQSCNFFYDQYRDFFRPQKNLTVMIWFLMLFDTFLLEKVFSTICFLQLSYDNIFFHVGPYFFLKYLCTK